MRIIKTPILPTSQMVIALGETQGDSAFRYPGGPPPRNDERSHLIAEGNERTLRSLISGARLEGANRAVFDKPDYLFGDADSSDHPSLCTTEDPWMSKIGDDRFYLACTDDITHCRTSYLQLPEEGWRAL